MASTADRHSELFTGTALTVFRLNGQLLSVAEELARSAGLTAARWQVLGAVTDEPLPVSAVARRFGTTRQSVQRIADLLVERRLAEYRPNPAHSRAKLLAPTEEGLEALRRIDPDHGRVADALVAELGEDGAERALESLHRLSRALDRLGEG
ncbi:MULTISPECIES: MarR family winged helix-turn-helix transcriptional regulator [Nocardiopsidaceae]|jgi:DNA-binding MarR family transcriptional regulator|uniref:MarR family transcriptional regulator n=2 Tax=Nocardiopsidaceae TaxID=83676 RepID=A0ABY6YQF0_9ACTN|nr:MULTISPECIES: MarR family transcriptional regulator [Nocardiopsaceae]MEE2050184.1 MarR family transcriptional regulator [Nocardiopsis umidischolae]WAE74622.1 MarR family transcriptional regulator [Streptomonospora nanhaiensis]